MAPKLRNWRHHGGLALAYALCSGCFIAARADFAPYDDSHFFKRVALHLLTAGQLAWNVDEGPVYGMTSLLFQGLAVPVAAVAPEHFMLSIRLLSWVGAVVTYMLLCSITRRLDGTLSATWLSLSPTVLFALLSGMETTVALALVSWTLWLLLSPTGRRQHWSLSPFAVLSVYLVRPDATLLVTPVLLALRWKESRRMPLREIGLLAAGLSAVLLACDAYFGTPLPLSFYAKHALLSPYDPAFVEGSRPSSYQRFAVFALFAAPAFGFALAKRDLTNTSLLLSATAHGIYHLFSTIDIMGMHGRFYAPAIPLLAVASARGLHVFEQEGYRKLAHLAPMAFLAAFAGMLLGGLLPIRAGFHPESVEPLFYAGSVPALALAMSCAHDAKRRTSAVLGLLFVCTLGSAGLLVGRQVRLHSDRDFLELQAARTTTARGLDALQQCLGSDTHVYHSEVGLVGLRLPKGKVTDVVGLQSPRWLFRAPGSFDQLCSADRPEAIFLPHRHYGELNREIRRGTCIEGYRQVVGRSSSPLFVRADVHERFLACAKTTKDPWISRP